MFSEENKPYNQDALVELPRPLPERMLSMELVQPTLIKNKHEQQRQRISDHRTYNKPK
jgi:hypothetical protein